MNYKYKTNQRPSYGIEYNTTLKCELWINDVPVVRNYKVSQKSNAEIINDLLLGNGKHTVTMKFFPNATSKEDSLITQEDIKWIKIKLVKAEVIPNSPYGETKNREELIDFRIPEIPVPVPGNGYFKPRQKGSNIGTSSNNKGFIKGIHHNHKRDIQKMNIPFFYF